MAVETAADIASFFDEEEFAEAAVYRSPVVGTDPVDCLVIMDRGQGRGVRKTGDDSPGFATSERHLWAMAGDGENQLADVRRGGTFTLAADGEVLKVEDLPKLDQTGHFWSVDLVLA